MLRPLLLLATVCCTALGSQSPLAHSSAGQTPGSAARRAAFVSTGAHAGMRGALLAGRGAACPALRARPSAFVAGRSLSRVPAGRRAAGALNLGMMSATLDAQLRDAAEQGLVDAVERLVKEGADVNSADPENLDKAAIHLAAHQGHIDTMFTLIKLGADVNQGTDSDSTPLHFACAYGHLGMVKMLLENGADPTAPNEFDETPLDMAKMKGRFSDRVDFVTIVKVLQEAIDQIPKPGRPGRK